MDPTLQFVCFLVALILFLIAAILHRPAMPAMLIALGLAAWVLVDVDNAAKAM